MDFILGIFTGISIILFIGYRAQQQDRKRMMEERQRRFEAMRASWLLGVRMTPSDMEYLNSCPPKYPLSKAHTDDLNAQLQAAIANDDFEEAARIRDLINRK